MTSKTSILLIIQQNPGIGYQALLAKIAPNYRNLNSARAALSRILKDSVSFGVLHRKGQQLFLTDKGAANLKVKMHDKLVLKLNQLMRIRTVWQNPDALIQHLSILLERSKIDSRLLDNARASVDFSVTDLENVRNKLEKHISHLNYLEKTLSIQLESLREHNFPASRHTTIQEMGRRLPVLVSLSNSSEVQLEHVAFDLSQNLSHPVIANLGAQPKGNRASVSINHLGEMVNRLPNQELTFPGIKAYVGLFTLELGREKINIKGPSHLLKKVFEGDTMSSSENQTPPDPNPKHPIPSPPMQPVPIPEEPAEGDEDEEEISSSR
jgi:hypothetical protein